MGPSLGSMLTQFFPSKPQFTEKDVPDLSGKVYVVTGSNTGLGKDVARILYTKNAKVYMGTRSEEKGNKAIEEIKASAPDSTGSLTRFHLDLADLPSIKASAEHVLSQEKRLHVLFNNAGVMGAEGPTVRTAQGYEMHMGVNCVGTFLFTKLLTPVLVDTAKDPDTPAGTVRVVYLSSIAAEMFAEKDVAIDMKNLDYSTEKWSKYRYGISKIGNWAYAVELSKRFKDAGVIGVPVNPGNLKSDLFRDQNVVFRTLTGPGNYEVIKGAYTELFGGLSPEITPEKAGHYVVPFGRLHPIRADLGNKAAKSEAEGGNGTTAKFWDWSEEQVKQYL